MEAELTFPIDNPNNDLKTLDPKLALKDLDEAKQIVREGGRKMTQMMMSLSKWQRAWSSIGGVDRTGRRSGRKMKPVKLPKTLWIMMMGASANQVTSAMILNIANIKIKNNTTVMVSNLPNRQELHGQIRNKRNIRDIKRVKRKSVLSSYKKRGSISSMNNAMARRS
jgi:hypothetical protein